jgi:hypothetical protein
MRTDYRYYCRIGMLGRVARRLIFEMIGQESLGAGVCYETPFIDR